MAIQNFLSGGFYGSIGKLTGRRWKNKRVVQAKFKPANPKTPAQEAQRRLFTRGSALAKLAQQVNWKAPQFDNPIRTDWNQRQTVAINALKDGATEWEALPLAPKDFKAQHIIGECQLVGINEAKEAKLFLQGTNLLENKKYACAIFINSGEKKGQIIVGSGTTDLEVSNYVTIRLPETDGIMGEECYIKIASIDDTETDTVTLSAGILLQQKTQTPYVFEPQLVSVEMDSDYTLKVKVKLGEEAIESYDAFTNINISLLDKAWTKETAVTDNKLDTDNWTNVATSFTVSRTTVAKSTATVSFSIQNTNLWQYEKFAAKLDISFDANNVKGADSEKNTQNISLTSQEFPEYLQEEYAWTDGQTLFAKVSTNQKVSGLWEMFGKVYLSNAITTNEEIIYTTEDMGWDELERSSDFAVTVQSGKTLSDDELDEIIDSAGWDLGFKDQGIYFAIDQADIKSFTGSITFGETDVPFKLATKGYRIINANNNADYVFEVNFTM